MADNLSACKTLCQGSYSVSQNWAETREAHRRAVRGQVVRAALDLLQERGAAAVTMSQLAARAGISRATLYNHFPDLEHVLLAFMSDELARFRADLDRRVADMDDPLDRLEAYLLAQSEYLAQAQHRFPFSTLESGPLGPHLGAAMDELMRYIRDLLRAMLVDADRAGHLREDLDIDLHVELILGLVEGTRPALLRGTLDPKAAADAMMRLLREGIVSQAP